MSDDEEEDQRPPISGVKNVFEAKESSFRSANDEDLRERLALIEVEHADLDAAIEALAAAPSHDRLILARLKKKKLQLKDLIQQIRDKLTPDIIA